MARVQVHTTQLIPDAHTDCVVHQPHLSFVLIILLSEGPADAMATNQFQKIIP